MTACAIDGCDRAVKARGWCVAHYDRWRRHGDPTAGGPPRTTSKKLGWPLNLLSRLELTDQGCLIFTGRCDRHGYARVIGPNGQLGMAHRLMYELVVGPISAGKELDHLCRVRNCVNPAHLEPVTHRENTLRGFGVTATNARKTHCPQGHLLDDTNTYVYPGGNRKCRTCSAEQRQRYENRKRQAVA